MARSPEVAGKPRTWREGAVLTNEAEGISLIVRGDDFGMCHAVNQGIRQAAVRGILTTATMMAPCPWIDEAALLARELGLPVGVHQTLTCEWDYLRWRPLTGGASLVGQDGTFVTSVDAARQGAAHEEIVTELLAQVEGLRRRGLDLEYLDVHMGVTDPEAYAEVSRRTGVPYLYSLDSSRPAIASMVTVSDRESAGKKEWLIDYLENLPDGLHMLVCHPGVESDELACLTAPDSAPYRWAAEYRVSDLAVLTDPDIREVVVRRGIRLCSFRQAMGQ